MKTKDKAVTIKTMHHACTIKTASKRLVHSPSKSSCVMGTPNSRLMEMTMSAVGNSEFLTTSFITFELISCWGQNIICFCYQK